jgi:acetoin utilization protein AcuB
MTPDPLTVPAYFPLLEAVAIMAERGFRHVPVTDREGRLVGMVSDRDVRTAVGDPSEALQRELTELEELRVSTVMTTPAESVGPETPLAEVARRLTAESLGALPVVDRGRQVIGLVSYVDLVRALLPMSAGDLRPDRAAARDVTG